MSTDNEELSPGYWYGSGLEAYYAEDYEEAVRCFTIAAEMGDADAQYELAERYNNGEGVEKDVNTAIDWYLKAAGQGHAEAQYELAEIARKRHADHLAVKLYLQAVELGALHAKVDLGYMYLHNKHTCDFGEASRWLKEAVDTPSSRNLASMFYWAECLEFGLGVAPDVEEAKRWYAQAVKDNEDEDAQYALDTLERIYSADGTPHDWQQEGVKAFNEGWRKAGSMEGRRLKQEAARWWIRAAEAGNVNAMMDLGLEFQRGKIWGFPASKAQSAYWFSRAAYMGNADAQRYLAYRYYYGVGVAKDRKQAAKWARKAARTWARTTVARGRVKWYLLDELGIKSPRFRIPRVKSNLHRTWTTPFLVRLLLFVLALLPIVLIFHMDRLTFVPITVEEALKRAETVKVTLPEQTVRLVADGKEKSLAVGSKVTVLGVYKKKLDKGNSPRVYWTNQQYLLQLRDGSLAHGPLMETAVGHPTLLPSGDTVMVKSVKKVKKRPIVQATGVVSAFDYAYTLEGLKETYALEDLKMYFPERVAYQYGGLKADTIESARTDTLANGKRAFWPSVRHTLYKVIPSTNKSGYFLYPRFQEWNEFLMKRWFRNLLTLAAFIAFIVILVRWVPRIPRHIKEGFRQGKYRRTYWLARCNNTKACYALGNMCHHGKNGVQQDMDEAVKWYTRAGELGNEKAAMALGRYYEQRRQYSLASRWYSDAGEAAKEDSDRTWKIRSRFNTAEVYNNLAISAEERGDLKKAFEDFLEGAELGHPILQYNVAQYYYFGKGMKVDYAEAFRWYLKAAEQDYAEAQSQVGYCYCTGKGVAKNMDKGIEWMRKAARQGNENAIENLKQLKLSW